MAAHDELADFKKMETRFRARVRRRRERFRKTAEALKPWLSAILQAADLQRRVSADLQSTERDAGRYEKVRGVDRVTEKRDRVRGASSTKSIASSLRPGFEVRHPPTTAFRAGFEVYWGAGGPVTD